MPLCKQLQNVLAFLVLLLALAPVHAATEPEGEPADRGRLAIVVGNSNYVSPRYDDLANASNDATKLSDSLRRLNFEVATGIDLTSAQFEELLKRYEGKLDSYSAVLIFYAGHGLQFNNENYLLPVDTLDPDSVEKLTERTIRLNDVIKRFQNPNRPTFVFLDACRNNPLGSGAAGAGNGLAKVEAGENIFVAFATQPGNVTVDGKGDNSPFTTALLQSVEIPGLSISDTMIRVRNETRKLTLDTQDPWEQSNLREQFYFTEQQVIDSQQLSQTLNRILADPSAKQQLMVQLASADSDLQSAVLLLGQQLPDVVRSVEIQGGKKNTDLQVASLAASGSEGALKTVSSDLESLLVLGKTPDGEEKAPGFDLNHRVQTELSRVGCYRQSIDGEWGPGSRKALADYYKRTKQDVAQLEPSVDVLSDLFLRSGRICKQPVAAPKKVATIQGEATVKSSGKATGRNANKPNKPVRKPAAPPPDIGAGIGIGGVF